MLCLCIALDSAAGGAGRAVHAALGPRLCHFLLVALLLTARVAVPVLGHFVPPSQLVQPDVKTMQSYCCYFSAQCAQAMQVDQSRLPTRAHQDVQEQC